jgi:integrase
VGRRGNNEGSISKRKDGRYMARYTVHTIEGPKQRTIMGRKGESREDVAGRLADALSDRNKGLTYDAGKLTVSEYLRTWLTDSVRDTVRQRTYEGYVNIVEGHISPAIGYVKLSKLTPAHVRRLYRDKLDSGLSNRTVRYIHTTLNKALKQAVADGLISRNAAASVKAPRPAKAEVRPLDRQQVHTFLRTVCGDRLEALYTVAVTTGLREGEILALRWEDVDFEADKLQVRRTASEARIGRVYETPKSGMGRSIRLTQKAAQSLREHRKRQLEERMERAGLWKDHDLVFPSEVGTSLGARNLQRAFKIRLKRAGLPETTRFHDLRHTCATLLLRQGVNPKLVQELLGHRDVALTLNVYSHVLPDMGDAAAGAMDDALSG